MLQQTRVETVIPYYERFMAKFPTLRALAEAPERDLLATWAGLGYYSRVRNLRKAARQMAAGGRFPAEYAALRALPGIGDYTAAAVASIAFGQPYAALDGNVMRVMARLTNDAGDLRSSGTRARLLEGAAHRLDRRNPGTFNQAMMELGAVVCTPANPSCMLCPVERLCEARAAGSERELPVKSRPGDRKVATVTLLAITGRHGILLRQRPAGSMRLAGFWELPDTAALPAAQVLERVGGFRHGITDTTYIIAVHRARIDRKPRDSVWVPFDRLHEFPLSTASRKALACLT